LSSAKLKMPPWTLAASGRWCLPNSATSGCPLLCRSVISASWVHARSASTWDWGRGRGDRRGGSNYRVWHGMAWYGMVWYGMVWHGMVWHGMVWYGMVWYGMAWHGLVWYGMVREGQSRARSGRGSSSAKPRPSPSPLPARAHLDGADTAEALQQREAVVQRRDVQEVHGAVLQALRGAALEDVEVVAARGERDRAAAPEQLRGRDGDGSRGGGQGGAMLAAAETGCRAAGLLSASRGRRALRARAGARRRDPRLPRCGELRLVPPSAARLMRPPPHPPDHHSAAVPTRKREGAPTLDPEPKAP
jgi:hypothetical protein